ncbi:alkaline phosphatase [Saprospiraceae bacterium]|jgi:alkaline phosphatase|nr:alkaline phosphatase [Saprospiraceae bacterium]MDF1867940.1 alkaline phosphatase [Saprospiraceae bacterium]
MKNTFLLLLIIGLFACNPKPNNNPDSYVLPEIKIKKHPKNIILMIGDGMGITQITAGMYMNGNKLNLEQFPMVGLHKSYSSDKLITDSAAGATAFASGIKTYNGAIGVNPDTIPVKTILEEAEEYGLATGLVSTSSIVHATPASFIAHQKLRKMYEEIATDFLNTEIDYFVGGGKAYFDIRDDGRVLSDELKAKGYYMSDYFQKDFNELDINFDQNFGYLTANKEPLKLTQGRDYFIAATQMAPTFLNNHSDNGFFLMIEGSQIDWGGHANDSEYIITEMIEFDKAIGKILDFAQEDGETLVIVTADHETGGYAINMGSTMDSIVAGFTTDYHTACLIPVFAFGPGAEIFGGIYENTEIYNKMRKAFNFKKINEESKPKSD